MYMPSERGKILARLADRKTSPDSHDQLISSLRNCSHQLELEFERKSMTFSMGVPEKFLDGQTLNGKVDGQDVSILIPESEKETADKISRGDILVIDAQYLSFDKFYRKVTFTGSLGTAPKKKAIEPEGEAPTPQPREEPTKPTNDPIEPLKEASAIPIESSQKPEKAKPEEAEPIPSAKIEKPIPTPNKPERITKESSPSTVNRAKGELGVFNNPDFNSSSPPDFTGNISSAQIISLLASKIGNSKEDAARVIDGFWDYVADIKNHYKKSRKSWLLVIPRIGSFRFSHGRRGQRKLSFIMNPERAAGRYRGPKSSSWTQRWSPKSKDLSVRRRISVYVSQYTGLPLRNVDEILNWFMERLNYYCSRGTVINFARRGTLRNRIIAGRTAISPRTGDTITIPSRSQYAFRPSSGFLKRLNAPEPPFPHTPRKKRLNRKRNRPARRKQAKTVPFSKAEAYCTYAIATVIVAIIFSAGIKGFIFKSVTKGFSEGLPYSVTLFFHIFIWLFLACFLPIALICKAAGSRLAYKLTLIASFLLTIGTIFSNYSLSRSGWIILSGILFFLTLRQLIIHHSRLNSPIFKTGKFSFFPFTGIFGEDDTPMPVHGMATVLSMLNGCLMLASGSVNNVVNATAWVFTIITLALAIKKDSKQ